MHKTASCVTAGLTATRPQPLCSCFSGDASTSFSCRRSEAAECNKQATTFGGVLCPARLRLARTLHGDSNLRGSNSRVLGGQGVGGGESFWRSGVGGKISVRQFYSCGAGSTFCVLHRLFSMGVGVGGVVGGSEGGVKKTTATKTVE